MKARHNSEQEILITYGMSEQAVMHQVRLVQKILSTRNSWCENHPDSTVPTMFSMVTLVIHRGFLTDTSHDTSFRNMIVRLAKKIEHQGKNVSVFTEVVSENPRALMAF